MSLDAQSLFTLLPAVYRTRDAANGGVLQALFTLLAAQAGVVEDNIQQLYDDQFIETCQSWAIPYIGDLIGYNSIYQTSAGVDSRAEVANTIGYRRRKGTLVALEQVAVDVSGRAAVVVEEFKRLIVNESMRHPRPRHTATLDLRNGAALDRLNSAFDHSSRTLDVHRISARNRTVNDPDPAPLDIALHGPGRFDIPNVAIYLWRWRSWPVAQAPAYALDARRYKFNALGLDIPLFSQPAAASAPFVRLSTRLDVPQPIQRDEFARRAADFYGPSLMLYADGAPIDVSRICCANLAGGASGVDGAWCTVPAGRIAIDPQLGRIQFAADLQPPQCLQVSYSYGFPAAIGGGPYDRSAYLTQVVPAQADFFAAVGTSDCPSPQSAIAQWNLQPPGTTGVIVLPNFERYRVDLTGPNALQLPSGSTLSIVAAEPVPAGGGRDVIWNQACVSFLGNLEIISPAAPVMPDGSSAAPGLLTLSGLWVAGQILIGGAASNVQISDSTLVPGLGAASLGLSPCEPSVIVSAAQTSLCLQRCISGPIAADAAASVRIGGCILDATSPCCVAYADADGSSAGADLSIEDSTVIGKVRTRTLRLASNTIFFARRARHDPWPAAIWCSRRQSGCVRFCYLPFDSITPRRYECLPPTADSEASFDPTFITLQYGQPSYALLSGDVPMALWRGADNGSQIGVYYQIEETEAVGNVQIRAPEYLPVAMESGVFLVPSRPLLRATPAPLAYGLRALSCCEGSTKAGEAAFISIGDQLL